MPVQYLLTKQNQDLWVESLIVIWITELYKKVKNICKYFLIKCSTKFFCRYVLSLFVFFSEVTININWYEIWVKVAARLQNPYIIVLLLAQIARCSIF